MDPSLCTKVKTIITIDVLCIFLDILISAKILFVSITSLFYYFLKRADLAPQPLPLRGLACAFHCEDLLYITFRISRFFKIHPPSNLNTHKGQHVSKETGDYGLKDIQLYSDQF